MKLEAITLAQLPGQLRQLLEEVTFLKAYSLPETQSVIVWVKDLATGKQKELEYSHHDARLLTTEERAQRLPRAESRGVGPEEWMATVSYRLEELTAVRYEVFVVQWRGAGPVLGTAEQIFYSPFRRSWEDMVRGIVATQAFPQQYRSWSTEQRVNYWVGRLYRMRREAGESAGDENAAFNVRLLSEMRSLEPELDRLLPLIFASLAAMEQTDARGIAEAFSARTSL